MKHNEYEQQRAQADKAWLKECASHVEAVLEARLPQPEGRLADLEAAIRWAALGPGKRIRAALVYAAAQACSPERDAATNKALDLCAAAVELIHAYSLIHDDLPCMDDDPVRRGKPATHIQFGEAIALLAGDAMQPMAYEWLAGMPIAPGLIVQAVQALARATGTQGMAGGQAIDLASTGKPMDEASLAEMHSLKTGALLNASVMLGAIVCGASSDKRQALGAYSRALGLAYQVMDDVLDEVGDSATLGKTAGKDREMGKTTYVSLLGVDRAREHALALNQQAQQAIVHLGEPARYLRALAELVVQRSH